MARTIGKTAYGEQTKAYAYSWKKEQHKEEEAEKGVCTYSRHCYYRQYRRVGAPYNKYPLRSRIGVA